MIRALMTFVFVGVVVYVGWHCRDVLFGIGFY
jgi:hypothetical protein